MTDHVYLMGFYDKRLNPEEHHRHDYYSRVFKSLEKAKDFVKVYSLHHYQMVTPIDRVGKWGTATEYSVTATDSRGETKTFYIYITELEVDES